MPKHTTDNVSALNVVARVLDAHLGIDIPATASTPRMCISLEEAQKRKLAIGYFPVVLMLRTETHGYRFATEWIAMGDGEGNVVFMRNIDHATFCGMVAKAVAAGVITRAEEKKILDALPPDFAEARITAKTAQPQSIPKSEAHKEAEYLEAKEHEARHRPAPPPQCAEVFGQALADESFTEEERAFWRAMTDRVVNGAEKPVRYVFRVDDRAEIPATPEEETPLERNSVERYLNARSNDGWLLVSAHPLHYVPGEAPVWRYTWKRAAE